MQIPRINSMVFGWWSSQPRGLPRVWPPCSGYRPCRSNLIPVSSWGEDFPYTIMTMPLGPLPSNYGRPWGEGPFWYFAKQETLTDNLCWLFERLQSLFSSEKSKLNLADEETWESSNCTFFAWFCLVGSPGFVIESWWGGNSRIHEPHCFCLTLSS